MSSTLSTMSGVVYMSAVLAGLIKGAHRGDETRLDDTALTAVGLVVQVRNPEERKHLVEAGNDVGTLQQGEITLR